MPRPVLLLIAGLAPSCASAPTARAIADLAPTVTYTASLAPAAERPVTPVLAGYVCELFAVAAPPTGNPIAQAAAAIISDRGAPFRGKSSLPIGTLWMTDAAVTAWRAALAERLAVEVQQLGSVTAVVSSQVTTILTVDLPHWPELQLTPRPDGLAIAAVTPGTDLEAALTEATLTEPSVIAPLDDAADATTAEAREELRLQGRLAAGESAGLFVPDRATGRGGQLLVLRPDDVPTSEQQAAAEREARTELVMVTEPSDRPRPLTWQVALNAIGERNRRPALLALVAPLDLPRVVDVLLAADEAELIAMTDRLRNVDPGSPDSRWLVERALWTTLVQRVERGELTSPMLAALVRHLGAIADDPALLQLLLQSSSSSESFARSLRDENLAALADRGTATRVTAFDWLRAHDTVVPDYEPLADQPTRRRALRRFLAQEAQQDAAGSER